MIQLEILQVLDCPNVPLLEQRIEQALAGVSIEWELRHLVIEDSQSAALAGMAGSPTLLVDGHDPISRVKSDPERVLQALSRCRGRCRRRSYCVGAEESIRNGLTNVDSR